MQTALLLLLSSFRHANHSQIVDSELAFCRGSTISVSPNPDGSWRTRDTQNESAHNVIDTKTYDGLNLLLDRLDGFFRAKTARRRDAHNFHTSPNVSQYPKIYQKGRLPRPTKQYINVAYFKHTT